MKIVVFSNQEVTYIQRKNKAKHELPSKLLAAIHKKNLKLCHIKTLLIT